MARSESLSSTRRTGNEATAATRPASYVHRLSHHLPYLPPQGEPNDAVVASSADLHTTPHAVRAVCGCSQQDRVVSQSGRIWIVRQRIRIGFEWIVANPHDHIHMGRIARRRRDGS